MLLDGIVFIIYSVDNGSENDGHDNKISPTHLRTQRELTSLALRQRTNRRDQLPDLPCHTHSRQSCRRFMRNGMVTSARTSHSTRTEIRSTAQVGLAVRLGVLQMSTSVGQSLREWSWVRTASHQRLAMLKQPFNNTERKSQAQI